jgi:hypothetical protein
MKPRTLAILAAVIVIITAIAAYGAYPRVTATNIARITADPQAFDGREVNLFGTVVERDEDGFVLADGTGTIEVDWAGTLPAVGTSRVLVHGFVRGRVVEVGNLLRFEDARVRAASVDLWSF